MNITENKKADKEKLLKYGFKEKNGIYTYFSEIMNGEFKLKIEVDASSCITTELREVLTDEIYTLHLVENSSGSFIGQIREEYDKILSDICENCFNTDIFKSDEAKEIIKYLKEKYDTELEYLWEKFPDNAVFRRKDNDKWFGAILTVKKDRFGFKSDEIVEVLDIKADKCEIPTIVDNKKYFNGYHMNKKSWITILLNGSLPIEEIKERIDRSYNLAAK